MFRIVEAQDSDLLERIYRFRYFILCEEQKVFKEEDYPDGMEYDEYDQYATHFVALDKNDTIAACFRLIHHSPIGYPTENVFNIDLSALNLKREKIGEVSRIFIHPTYRHLKTSREIFMLFKTPLYFKMIELGLEYTLGALENRFYFLLYKYGYPYEMIGEASFYGGKQRFPALLSIHKLLQANPELCKKELCKGVRRL
jgi:N-acyl-L-homoserine lactone synthetase